MMGLSDPDRVAFDGMALSMKRQGYDTRGVSSLLDVLCTLCTTWLRL